MIRLSEEFTFAPLNLCSIRNQSYVQVEIKLMTNIRASEKILGSFFAKIIVGPQEDRNPQFFGTMIHYTFSETGVYWHREPLCPFETLC